jgi:hypothetical protein
MKSAVSPIPKPYPNFLAVAEVTRRRLAALSTWLFVTPQTLRRSPEENPALQVVVNVALGSATRTSRVVLTKVENAVKVEPVGSS